MKNTVMSAIAAASILLASATPVFAHSGHPTEQEALQSLSASDLRALLTGQLGEHVLLAFSATGAALGGRDAQFKAAAAQLDNNSIDISKSIGAVYGQGAQDAFLPLWRKHIGFVVDYTTALGAGDKAKSDKAVNDLVQYSEDFGAFLASANPNLPKATVAGLVKSHILGLKSAIDAQAAKDPVAAYAALREAYAHMDMIAKPLAAGIAMQFMDKFAGRAEDPAANLRAALTQGLKEHTYLAALATGAALGGRDAEFKAAAGALDGNSVDLSKAIGSVYGAGAGDAFLPLWRKHIGFVVDYTTGLATKDKAKSDKAVADLIGYTQDFGAFLSGASPALPQATVADLVKTHILGLKAVIDAQAAGDVTTVYSELRGAYAHMGMIADPLSAAISAQFADKFGARPVMGLPVTGGSSADATLPIIVVAAAIISILTMGGVALKRVAIRKK